MGNDRKPYVVYGAICLGLALYFLTSGDVPQAARGTKNTAMAGGSGSGGSGGAGKNSGEDAQSVFESQFFLGGVPSKPIEDENKLRRQSGDGGEEPDILDPADKDNPVNPQTGRPYPNSVMKQFSTLRQKFPDNSLIPKKNTPEAKTREAEERKQMFGLQSLVAQGQATPEQITSYYDMRSKPERDRVELLDYVLQSYGPKMSDQVKEQYGKILEATKKTMESYNTMRDQAIEKARNR